MKFLLKVAVFVLALAFACSAQTATPVQNFFGGGVSFNNSGTPSIAGTAFYAKSVNDGSGTYSFTVFDALPNSLKPLTVTTNVGTGIAQKVFCVSGVCIYAPITAGFSWQGSNLGWNWTGGFIAPIKLKKGWYVAPAIRFAKSSVSNGTGYQLIPGGFVGKSF